VINYAFVVIQFVLIDTVKCPMCHCLCPLLSKFPVHRSNQTQSTEPGGLEWNIYNTDLNLAGLMVSLLNLA